MKKLVLDFDETLVYSTSQSMGPECVPITVDDTTFYTMLRPGTKDFLEFARRKFEVVVWSTGQENYLNAVWKYIDMDGFTLWGREHCKTMESNSTNSPEPYEKPLRLLTEDLSQIVIVDNTPSVFTKYPLNGILCRTWRGEPYDTELEHLSYYLDWLNQQPSMQRDHHAWRLETVCLRSR